MPHGGGRHTGVVLEEMPDGGAWLSPSLPLRSGPHQRTCVIWKRVDARR